jgi:LL-diaminopimelate aminotransferase
MTFTSRCLDEANVVVIPGAGFSKHTGDWFRIALTVEVDRIAEAVERMKRIDW